jgi:hypothetical protein
MNTKYFYLLDEDAALDIETVEPKPRKSKKTKVSHSQDNPGVAGGYTEEREYKAQVRRDGYELNDEVLS